MGVREYRAEGNDARWLWENWVPGNHRQFARYRRLNKRYLRRRHKLRIAIDSRDFVIL